MRHSIDFNGRQGVIKPGGYDHALLELSRNLPGRRRWRDGRLEFENIPSNWNAVSELYGPTVAAWTQPAIDRLGVAEEKELSRAALLARRVQELPPEASKWIFKTQPFKHQLVSWFISRDEESFAYLMEMGTGKSKVLTDIIAWLYLSGKIDAALIVAPNGVNRQWVTQQLPMHMPEPVVYKADVVNTASIRTKTGLRRFNDLLAFDGLRIGAINCEALSTEAGAKVAEMFLMRTRSLLGVDESARFKNPSAARTKLMFKLAKLAPYRRIMTGTPITKGIEDLYAQFRILNSDIIGMTTFTAFRSRYCRMGGFEGRQIIGYQNEAELHEKLAPYSFRVTKDECLDLPPKIYQVREFNLSAEQARMYKEMKDEALANIESGVVDVANGAAVLIKLHQIACGFLGDRDETTGTPYIAWREEKNPRISALMEVLEEAADPPTIIWCRFREDIRQVLEAVRSSGRNAVPYLGGMTDAQKDASVSRFMSGEADVFVGQVDAGGTGLNLQRATLVIYYSNSFNLESRLQSEDRAHRMGQTKSVTYVDLMARKTVDERIVTVLKGKSTLASNTLDAIKKFLDVGEGAEE